MNWENIKLILSRELKDQVRDRRTLFTVLVLPLLLYPLMGMAMLQVSQFSHQHALKIWFIGAENLPAEPALLVDGQINPDYQTEAANSEIAIVKDADDERILAVVRQIYGSEEFTEGEQVVKDILQRELATRKADLAILLPEKLVIGDQADKADQANEADPNAESAGLQKLFVFHNSASDKSNMAAEQVGKMISRWQQKITFQLLDQHDVELESLTSIQPIYTDVANKQKKQAATWAKILPFIILIWSLTGAFYPAVDLCAGEKERGTFETLLSSPAKRSEIAIGKLLTVMTFSMTTSLLNLISMGVTGLFVVSRLGAQMGGGAMPGLGMPPTSSLFWLLLALVPVSALFSAVALAAASFAKSSKEGQYYLVPLMMISMPLMMVPMMPAAKLDFGTSLIPVSGLMLLLRGLIEGQYTEALQFGGLVVTVTLVCCWLSIRWVVVQFSSESVIFRPSERFSVSVWLRQVFRERHELPVIGHALLCGILILVIKFFMSMGASVPLDWMQFSKQTVVVLVAAVGVPAVLMAMFLTRNPTKTLKLRTCSLPVACAAVLAAILLHPAIMWLTNLVMAVYPASGDLSLAESMMSAIFADAPGLWAMILVIAVAPAVFEELAFRGFILSGCESWGSKFQAILISSILFGLAHSIIQQSIVTFFIGCLLGFIAVQTRSLIPCVLYHCCHNSISLCMSMVNETTMFRYPLLQYFLAKSKEGGFEYLLLPALVMTGLGLFLVFYFWKYRDELDAKPVPADEPTELSGKSLTAESNA